MTPPQQTRIVANRRPDSDRGAAAAEYAVVASLIAAVIAGSVTALGVGVQGLFVLPVGL
jgi:Flp pilus assembly pilin Flp